jgi:hypothetical protein
MSYVRWGQDGSHIYVIAIKGRTLLCVGCDLPNYSCTTVEAFFNNHRGE